MCKAGAAPERIPVRAIVGHFSIGATLELRQQVAGKTDVVAAPVKQTISGGENISGRACSFAATVVPFNGLVVAWSGLTLSLTATATAGAKPVVKADLPIASVLVYAMQKWSGDEDDVLQWTLVGIRVGSDSNGNSGWGNGSCSGDGVSVALALPAVLLESVCGGGGGGGGKGLALRLVPRTACLTAARFTSCPLLYIGGGGDSVSGGGDSFSTKVND